jgi:hypothetical protein
MVPLGIGVVFSPNTKQLVPPQLSDLPDDVAEAPASTEASVMPAGRPKLHCTAVGCAPPADEIEIGTDTVEPASPDPDPMLMDTDCAIKAAGPKSTSTSRTRKFLRIC